MNYYVPMSHQMPEQPYFCFPVPNFPNNPNPSTNRFIYIKHDFVNPAPSAPKVLVNPHFKKKVYVNPQFKPPQPVPAPPKPKIHVNPNVLKNFLKVPKVEPTIEKPTTVISTRNKLVRIPCDTTNTVNRKRRNSLITKYKIVRSTGAKNGAISRFKLDKREKVLNKSTVKPVRKKYVYVNRFLSIDVMAKNVLLKKNSNLLKPGFVNINGILYKKSPNSLRKASDSSMNKSLRTPLKSQKTNSKYKLVRKETKLVRKDAKRNSLVRRYKLIRSTKSPLIKATPSKMRKCNIPCPTFRKFGKCPGKTAGTCFKLHNPDQIVLCTRFLQGACRDERCLLSHKVSLEKMPTCKFFLDGQCSKDNCPYLHVKISPRAEICRDFLEGFCKKGAECDKRHQFLCPDFEKNKRCEKRRCPYPHGNAVRKNSKVLKTFAKKCSTRKKKIAKESEVLEKNRYYEDLDKAERVESQEKVIKTVSRDRPKLGELPAFIPFF